MDSTIQFKESGIPLRIEIQNLSSNDEKDWNQVPRSRNPKTLLDSFGCMGRRDWMRARDNHPIIAHLLSTKWANPIFHLSSSRFVKKVEMETLLYISYPMQNKNNAMR